MKIRVCKWENEIGSNIPEHGLMVFPSFENAKQYFITLTEFTQQLDRVAPGTAHIQVDLIEENRIQSVFFVKQ